MKKNENPVSVGAVIGVPIFMGVMLLLLLLLLGTLLVQAEKLSVGHIPMWMLVTLAICGFVQAFLAACRAMRSKFLWGILASSVFLLGLVVLSVLWFGQPIDISRVLTVSGVTLLSALVGSVIGASRLKRKRNR